ncbi:MAG: hypothetical protein SNF93_03640 [Rikenellaceae bacterium]
MKLDLKYRLSIGALSVIALLPLPVLYIIGDVIYFFIYYVARYRRKTVRVNLNLAFADRPEYNIPTIERQFYHHLCDIFIESIKVLHISDEQMRKRFVVTNPELLDELSREGSSQALMLGHYCNWEWCQAMSLYFNGRDDALVQVYKPLHSKTMDRIILKLRSRYGLENIPQQRAIRQLFEIQNQGRNYIVGLISDQRPSGRNFQHWIKFLGMDTPYVVGGEKIGLKTNAVFHYVSFQKIKRGYYSLTYERLAPPAEGEYTEGYYTRQFLSKLEQSINRAPQYWLWSHKIWKRGVDGKMTNYYK